MTNSMEATGKLGVVVTGSLAEGIKVRAMRGMVSDVMSKTEGAETGTNKQEKEKKK